MKILIVTQYFYPEQLRINDLAVELAKRGHQVKVITGIPNYPYGRFFKGYSIFGPRKEVYNGLPVFRLPIFPRGKNFVTLSVNYVSFALSGLVWALFTKEFPDVILALGTSPVTQAIPGIVLAKKRKIPVILYLQDLWPESVIEVLNLKNKFLKSIFSKISNFVYNNTSMIFVSSRPFIDNLLSRGISSKKIEYVPQYAEDFYRPIERKNDQSFSDGKLKIAYTGNIGYTQGLDKLIEVAKILRKSGKGNNVNFILVGDGRFKNEMIELVKTNGLEEMFTFINQQPPEKIPELLAECDLAYICLKDSVIGRSTVPAKLQSYMACGIPILGVIKGEAAKIISEANCGFVVEDGDAHSISEKIINIMQLSREELIKMGINGRKYCEENFSKSVVLNKIEVILNNLLNTKGVG